MNKELCKMFNAFSHIFSHFHKSFSTFSVTRNVKGVTIREGGGQKGAEGSPNIYHPFCYNFLLSHCLHFFIFSATSVYETRSVSVRCACTIPYTSHKDSNMFMNHHITTYSLCFQPFCFTYLPSHCAHFL